MTLPLVLLGAYPPQVSRMGLGLAALGRPEYINLGHAADLQAKDMVFMQAHAFKVLDAAWAAGVRYFDAARSYGQSEAFLSAWLLSRGHHALVEVDNAVVGSKWGYTYVANWQMGAVAHEIKDHSASNLEKQWPETLATLGRQPDVYFIHSATLETGVLADQRVLAKLVSLSQEGVRVGLSTSGPQQAEVLQQALAAQLDGINPFSVVQATWNLLEPSAGAALAQAYAAGWGVVVKEGVANGLLTSRAKLPDALVQAAQQLNTTPDAVALAAALAQPWVSVVLSGATTTQQLHSNLSALNLKLSADLLSQLNALAQPATQYWAQRSALNWN